jgi:hypothetical protein
MMIEETKEALKQLSESDTPSLLNDKFLVRTVSREELLANKIKKSQCPEHIKPLLKGFEYYGQDSQAHYLVPPVNA